MALLDGFFKKTYLATCYCNNCHVHQEVQIPKGITVTQYVESGTGKCSNCGCQVLIVDYKQIDEYKEKPRIDLRPRPSTPRVELIKGRHQQRASVPEPRPSTKPLGYQPLPKNQNHNDAIDFSLKRQPKEPDFSLRGSSEEGEEFDSLNPTKIFREEPADFWTGKQNRRDERRKRRGDNN